MFVSCPHCRDLVATDRQTGLPPLLCTRCGGVLREPEAHDAALPPVAGSGLSFASFLRADDPSGSSATEAAAPAGISAGVSSAPIGVEEAVEPAATPAAGDTEPPAMADPSLAIPPDALERDALEPDALESRAVERDARGTFESALPAADRPAALAAPATPSFMRVPAATAAPLRTAKWQWAAVFVLSSLLVIQVLVADRARLAADPGWRPTITTLCGLLGCSVPAWHQPGAIAMLSRDVSPVAGSPGGLEVRATFRNDARWSQPWPVLLLSLSDADGRVLGSRAFTPREYLGADATQTELASGQSARIALRLHEPNPDVVAFSFDFR